LFVSTAEGAAILIDRWRLQPSGDHVSQETHWVEADAPTSLGDGFPTLRTDLEDAGLADAEIVPCIEIYETITTDAGTKTIHKDFARVGNRFLWDAENGARGRPLEAGASREARGDP
jgi:hypothetical protein